MLVDEFMPEAGRHVLTVWDIERAEKVADLGPQADKHPNGYIESVAFSPDRKWVVVWGAADEKAAYLRRWDLAPKRLVWDVRVEKADFVRDLNISPDGKAIYLGYGHLFGFDADTGRERFRHRSPVTLPEDWRKEGTWGYRFHRVGNWLAVAIQGQGVAVFEPETGELIRLLEVPGAKQIGVSADGTRLAAGGLGDHPTVRVFDTATWTQKWVGTLSPRSELAAVRFSPDGKRLLATYWGGAVSAELFVLSE
jgi:WD40 repeat protein